MGISQGKSKRTKTGAKLLKKRDKIKAELGKDTLSVSVGKEQKKKVKGTGSTEKVRLMKAEFVNVLDPKNKKHAKAKIETVLENNANRHYVRRNILTLGALVKTELGKVKITSKPGQHGVLNGVLVE